MHAARTFQKVSRRTYRTLLIGVIGLAAFLAEDRTQIACITLRDSCRPAHLRRRAPSVRYGPFSNSVQRCEERIARDFNEATPNSSQVQDLLCRTVGKQLSLASGTFYPLYIWVLALCSRRSFLPILSPHWAEAMFAGTVKQPVTFDLTSRPSI